MGAKSGSQARSLPVASELRANLDAYLPATVLSRLDKDIPAELRLYQAEALMELDRQNESLDCLEGSLPRLKGDLLAKAEYMRSILLLRVNQVDAAILGAQRAANLAKDSELRATALGWFSVGLARKGCLGMAEAALREAIELAPNAPGLLQAQARMYLEADRRLEARKIYERMQIHPDVWTEVHGTWGCSQVAYLFGEFDEADRLAEEALQISSEIISPLFIQAKIALAREDPEKLMNMVNMLTERSPQSDSLKNWQAELELMMRRKGKDGKRKRLPAFPTLVQRKDFCGPAVVELVMRYWQGSAAYPNEYIAKKIMFSQAGTPIYRMREFFHVVAFETIQTFVPVAKLKDLIEAGFPTIIQEEFSNTSHVAVVIGYDEDAQQFELQDPMTHSLTRITEQELNRLRHTYLDAALIAFPRGRGYEKNLGALGIYDNQALLWCDQAILALDQDRPQAAITQAEKVVKRLPALPLGWVLLLHAKLNYWKSGILKKRSKVNGQVRQLPIEAEEPLEARRASFYVSLSEAKEHHLGEGFLDQFEGSSALLDGYFSHAQEAFQRAIEEDPQNARSYTSLAEVYFNTRNFIKAYEAASKALEQDPVLFAANAWMARILAIRGNEQAALYAHMTVDLNPEDWISHLALGEALLQAGRLQEAKREADVADGLSADQPAVAILRGMIFDRLGEPAQSAEELQLVLEQGKNLAPVQQYQVNQLLARFAFESGLFSEALEHLNHLLDISTNDPWGLQLQAAVRCEEWLKRKDRVTEYILEELHQNYVMAIQANQGDIHIIRDYLHYLEVFAGIKACLSVLKELRLAYPENGNLWFWTGDLLIRSGKKEMAVKAMVKALSRADGVRNRDELNEATRLILEVLGLDDAERILLAKGIPEGGSSMVERQRSLGLALASSPSPDDWDRARELLLYSLSFDPEDAQVMLHLGDISTEEEYRESCYRRALELAPDWTYARANLANYLVEHRRVKEAWEFTSGHAFEDIEMMRVHGCVLLGLGHFEEAASILEQAMQQREAEDQHLYENLWQAYLHCGNDQAALKTARKGLRLFGGEWYIRVAESLRMVGHLDKAEAVLKRGFNKGLSRDEILRAEYEIASIRNDDVTARRILEELLLSEEELIDDGHLGWAQSRYLQILVNHGEIEQAWRFLEGESLNAEGWGEAAWSIALSEAGEITLTLAERNLESDPEQYQGLYAKAEALSRLGREEEAWGTLETLRRVFPEDHYAYEKIALLWASQNKLEKAFEYADRSVDLGVFCPYAWATRGLVQFLNGRYKEALTDLQEGWKRADPLRRERYVYYWWLLAELQGDVEITEQLKSQAIQESRTRLDSIILGVIEVKLASQLTTQNFSD